MLLVGGFETGNEPTNGVEVILSFFYTNCTYTCTMQGKTFSRLQALLGDQRGRRVRRERLAQGRGLSDALTACLSASAHSFAETKERLS